jgi:D-alanyl-D-alanine carboxypeptidase/D-alanyl-D-alanine-endopeptidase (penicillin-binding protein 4)
MGRLGPPGRRRPEARRSLPIALAAMVATVVTACSVPANFSRPAATSTQSLSLPSSAPSGGLPLGLHLSVTTIPAGGCTVATITGSPQHLLVVVRDGRGDGVAPSVRLRHGRGRVRICEGWTGRSVIGLRVVSPGHALPSKTAALRVRPAPWMIQVHRLLARLPVSVSVALGGAVLFANLGDVPRVPASNEKLLLSMALLDRFGPHDTIRTTAESRAPQRGLVHGNLWLVGHGDPEVGPATLEELARRIVAAGVRRVAGSVVGDSSTFTRERWAPGWHKIALQFISLPTALTFEANQGAHGFVFDPERRAAAALTADLQSHGVRVDGAPRVGHVPPTVEAIAAVRSAPLEEILRRQNVSSLNFDAEVLDKMLGASVFGPPGSIAKGAAAIQDWASKHGVAVVTKDGSGLSYQDRFTTNGMVRLLGVADHSAWGPSLHSTLPVPGQGTLTGRLGGLRVRAKTGTLIRNVSTLSGWVLLSGSGRWAEFSVLSRGLPENRAVRIEDAVVRIIAEHA